MSDSTEIESLRRALEESKAQTEAAKAQAEAAKAQAEAAKAQAEAAKAQAEAARARAETAEAGEERERKTREAEQRKHQKTTLDEFLYNCHFFLYKKLVLSAKSAYCLGLATSVDRKYYPKFLRPWSQFTTSQCQSYLDQIRGVCGKRRLFNQESSTRDQGTAIQRKLAGTETSISHFETFAVEDPVSEIFSVLQKERRICQEFQFSRLRFNNTILGIEQSSQDPMGYSETSEVLHNQWQANTQRTAFQGLPRGNPDRFGIRMRQDGTETLAFVYDFKAAHKFSTKYLEVALANEKLFMEVNQRKSSNKCPNNEQAREKEMGEARIAMGLTQVFHYMLHYGVAYGYVAAGKCLVFLHFDPTNPQVLYYHRCIPENDVEGESPENLATEVSRTAVAQLASFCLLTLRSQPLKGDAYIKAMQTAKRTLKQWGDCYDDAAHHAALDESESLTESVKSMETDDSDFKPTSGSKSKSDSKTVATSKTYSLRSSLKSSCKPGGLSRRSHDDEEEDGQGSSSSRRRSLIDARSKMEPNEQCHEDQNASKSNSCAKSTERCNEDSNSLISEEIFLSKKYCTQACLLGLKHGGYLDENCPNVASHCATKGSTRHLINASEFTRMVSDRLRQSPYQDCEALHGRGKYGAAGVLFKLILVPYGYTFVGKGFWPRFVDRLEHETRIYAHLDKLQGDVVPVHLGAVHIDEGYIFPGLGIIYDMMLMSWGGEEVTTIHSLEANKAWRAVATAGVGHGDERCRNMLWNAERSRVMIIDFDQAWMLKEERLLTEDKTKRKRQKTALRTSRVEGLVE